MLRHCCSIPSFLQFPFSLTISAKYSCKRDSFSQRFSKRDITLPHSNVTVSHGCVPCAIGCQNLVLTSGSHNFISGTRDSREMWYRTKPTTDYLEWTGAAATAGAQQEGAGRWPQWGKSSRSEQRRQAQAPASVIAAAKTITRQVYMQLLVADVTNQPQFIGRDWLGDIERAKHYKGLRQTCGNL